MNPTADLKDLKLEEYQQKLIVNQLRREVFSQLDPTASASMFNALAEAEQKLSEIEKQVAVELSLRSAGGVLGAESTGLEAKAELRMAQTPTSYYHLLDQTETPLFTCSVINASNDIRRVRVIGFVEGYSARSVDTAELAPGDQVSFDQLPTFFPQTLKEINELTRATLNVLIEDLDTGKTEIHRTYPIWLLARTTAPLAVKDPKTGAWQDMTPYLGAYVTPNAPEVMAFLAEAINHHPEKRFVGYQADETQVEPQIKALFSALQNAGIHYVNSVIDFSPDTGSANQRVRLPRESLKHKSANCIDGTVLFASLLEAISLSPAIVIIPGHAFLAWETWSGAPDSWRYLETTMIGSHTFEQSTASAQKTAETYLELAKQDPARFRLQPLRILRTSYGITPME
jgi:hypothetical protein